jgi:hypothetical protein
LPEKKLPRPLTSISPGKLEASRLSRELELILSAALRQAPAVTLSREKAEILLADANSLTSNLLHIRENALGNLR